MPEEVMSKIVDAIEIIKSGMCKKIAVNRNITIYECKNIIRIDIKWEELEKW